MKILILNFYITLYEKLVAHAIKLKPYAANLPKVITFYYYYDYCLILFSIINPLTASLYVPTNYRLTSIIVQPIIDIIILVNYI